MSDDMAEDYLMSYSEMDVEESIGYSLKNYNKGDSVVVDAYHKDPTIQILLIDNLKRIVIIEKC